MDAKETWDDWGARLYSNAREIPQTEHRTGYHVSLLFEEFYNQGILTSRIPCKENSQVIFQESAGFLADELIAGCG